MSRMLDRVLPDLRFAVRSLRRTPIFALTAALVLGLGIGANTTVFTIVNTLLLRPLPFDRADDVVQVRRRTPLGSSGSFPMHDYLALTTQRGALSALVILDVISAGRYTLITANAADQSPRAASAPAFSPCSASRPFAADYLRRAMTFRVGRSRP